MSKLKHVGFQWLNTSHFRRKIPGDASDARDWNEVVLLLDAEAEISRLEAELELLKAKLSPFHGLWQDAEGTIPVTAMGQPVGRIESPEGEVMVQRFAANRPVVREDGYVWLRDKTEWMESE